jgi:tRNA-splicing ligase RtcB
VKQREKTMTTPYEVLHEPGRHPIKAWTRGVSFDDNSKNQLQNLAALPFIHKWIAVMPDVHLGKGATIGSVIPTVGAVIPAAVGVDLGCGMIAVKTDLTANQLPDSLEAVRSRIETLVPHGMQRTVRGGRDKGSWGEPPHDVLTAWNGLSERFAYLCEKHPFLKNTNNLMHLGTLGTGNHFIEICLDENDAVWIMLHSGSRGVGNRIGSHFIEQAKLDMERWFIHLPDRDLAYIPEGSAHFDDYIQAVAWAQDFARINREVMMARTVQALREVLKIPIEAHLEAVNCHHNYIRREHHYGANVWVTRKGAVSARLGEMGIIPGSMGAKSFIVKGLGNAESFCSCSHGAGRVMSRTEAKKRVSLEEHIEATQGIECRKDEAVIDETPSAYKPIDRVMAAQADLVEVVHTLKQVVCVKG